MGGQIRLIATLKDKADIISTFRLYRDVFPHLNPKDIEQYIIDKQMVWKYGVAIQFKHYKQKRKKGTFTTKVGDIHLMKMCKVNGGMSDLVFNEWLDLLKRGRIVLSVRQDNHRAIKFYERHNFKIQSEISWGKDKIKGYVMTLNFDRTIYY